MSFSEIVHGMWVGSRPRLIKELETCFDLVVLAADEWQPPTSTFKTLGIVRAPMLDELKGMPLEDKTKALHAAKAVIEALAEKKRVLITCWAGLNRSVLIAAIVLTKEPFNMTPNEAIAHLRSIRSNDAFSNPNFESFLHDIAEEALSEAQPYGSNS